MSALKNSLFNWCKFNNKEYLLDEWDISKNKLSTEEITYASNKKYWWKCSNNHEWEVSVYHRTKGNGCPICSNKKLLVGYNDLLTTNPNVSSEFHQILNGDLKPQDLIYSTSKKVWWKCNKCGNEWETAVRHRTLDKKTGCPKCALAIREKNKSLTALKSNGGIKDKVLIDEWDYERNFPLKPEDFNRGTNKMVWWKCKNNHSWQARINNRAILGRGCPYCSSQKLLVGYNDFATVHPELLEEWDYEKNTIKPDSVMSGSRTKVWWKCSVGHSYQATLNHRTSPNSTGCPICYSGRQTSFAEQAVYYYVKKVFPDAINRYNNIYGSKFELDIYIPSYNTAIEYDGEAWHKNDKLEREQRKYKLCNEHGIQLIRLREKSYPLGSDVADYGFAYDNLYEHKVLQCAIIDLLKFLLFHPLTLPIDVNIERDKNEIYSNIYKIEKESFEIKHPEISKEWHPTLNGDIKPSMFKPRSDYKAWWKCSICGYEWQTTIGHRTEGTGCPRCGIIKSSSKKCLRVAKCDLKTKEVIEIYNSITEAGTKNKISISNITSVCKGNRPNAGGYFWKYIK